MQLEQALRNFPANDRNDYPQQFSALATQLLNNHTLHAGAHSYRIVECEVYCTMKGHEDPYIHGRDEQSQSCTWYFNDFGLDLTFGDEKKGVKASFLIRGIRDLSENPEYTSGPAKVVRRLFSGMGNAFADNGGLYLQAGEQFADDQVYTATRVNLPEKDTDFRNRKYRYIVELQKEHKFPGKEALVRGLYKEEKISSEQVKKALGYEIRN